MSKDNERRKFTRIRFNTVATLVQSETVIHTHVLDISINGVLLETPEKYEMRVDEPASISIFLSEDAEIQMQVNLVHSGTHFLGFHCHNIDVDSIAHLRRLIELNMDEQNASERVLEEMVLQHGQI